MHQGRWYSRHGWWMDDDVRSEDGRGARLKIEDGSLPSRCSFLVCFGNISFEYFLGLDSALDFALKCCSERYSGRSSWSNLFCSILGEIVKQFLSCVSESYTSRSSKGTARLLRWVRSSAVLVTVACYFEILLYPVEPRFRSAAFLFAGPLSSCIRSTAHAATFLSESLPWIRCLTGIPCLGWWSRCRLKLSKLMQQSNSIEYPRDSRLTIVVLGQPWAIGARFCPWMAMKFLLFSSHVSLTYSFSDEWYESVLDSFFRPSYFFQRPTKHVKSCNMFYTPAGE